MALDGGDNGGLLGGRAALGPAVSHSRLARDADTARAASRARLATAEPGDIVALSHCSLGSVQCQDRKAALSLSALRSLLSQQIMRFQ